MNWKGEVLLESLEDPKVLDTLQVDSVQEITDQDGIWHVCTVIVTNDQLKTVSSYLKDGPWFMHFGNGKETAVVFKDTVFTFSSSDRETLEKVKECARKLHIPEEELNFSIR